MQLEHRMGQGGRATGKRGMAVRGPNTGPGRGFGDQLPDLDPIVMQRIAADAWMIDVLAELQEAALDREMHAVAEHLAVTTRLVQGEIARKRNEARRTPRSLATHQAMYPATRRN